MFGFSHKEDIQLNNIALHIECLWSSMAELSYLTETSKLKVAEFWHIMNNIESATGQLENTVSEFLPEHLMTRRWCQHALADHKLAMKQHWKGQKTGQRRKFLIIKM